MKKKNKKKRFAPQFTGDYIEIGESCKDCVHSDIPTLSIAKVRCIYHKPKTTFHKNHGWICYSFSQKISGTNEDEGGMQY